MKTFTLNVLRWLAVIPATAIVFVASNMLVSLIMNLSHRGETVFFIRWETAAPWVVGIFQSAVAPYYAVKAAAFVAPNNKIVASAIAAILFIAFLTLCVLGLIAYDASPDSLPKWALFGLVMISLVSACYAVFEQYQEDLLEVSERAARNARSHYFGKQEYPADEEMNVTA